MSALQRNIFMEFEGIKFTEEDMKTLIEKLYTEVSEIENNTASMLEGSKGKSADAFAQAMHSIVSELTYCTLEVIEQASTLNESKNIIADADNALATAMTRGN